MKTIRENGSWLRPRAALILGIVIAAAALRILPHPMNFAPIGAIALFSGAYFSSKRVAAAVSLLSVAAGDMFLGFHTLILWVYGSFLICVLIGVWLQSNRSAPRIAAATLAGATQFFLVTNFAVWVTSTESYPKTWSGLLECYLAGIPFFWNTIAGDAFYAALLFGAMALAEKWFPSVREPLPGMAAQK